MSRRLVVFFALIALLIPHTPSSALGSLDEYLRAGALKTPGALVVDPRDGKVLAENQPDSLRIPASVLKLLSTTTALNTLGTEKTFTTSIWSTSKPNAFILIGEMDPWLTSTLALAKKNKQRYLPTLFSKANPKKMKSLTVYYSGLYGKDLKDLTLHLRKQRIQVKAVPLPMTDAQARAKKQVATMTSEPITTMVSFAVLWSDNQLADRFLKTSAKKAGNTLTAEGLTKTVSKVLADLEVPTPGLYLEDGSGLSKKNRVSARTIASLLIKIRNNPTFQSIYDGLPIGGLTGTLANRFSNAPQAVGHVHAKTGFLSNVVSMAGYVESGENEYVFVIIVDGIQPRLSARKAAREVMDQMLATIVTGNQQTP